MNSEKNKNQVVKDEIKINKKSRIVNNVNEKKKIWYFKRILWKNEKDILL